MFVIRDLIDNLNISESLSWALEKDPVNEFTRTRLLEIILGLRPIVSHCSNILDRHYDH